MYLITSKNKKIFNCFFILLICQFLFACAKNNSLVEESHNFTNFIEALNKGEYQKAYDLIEVELVSNPTDQNLLYWKAQALSGLGEIDIYKLFPIVQMKLFSVAINEWSEMEKFSKRTIELTEITILDSGTNRYSLEELEKLKKEIQNNDDPAKVEYKVESINVDFDSNFRQKYCYAKYTVSSKYFLNTKDEKLQYYTSFPKVQNETCDLTARQNNLTWLALQVREDQLNSIDGQIKKIEERFYKQKYLKIGMALVESMPILKNIPTFILPLGLHIFNALNILEQIHSNPDNSDRLLANSRNQSLILSTYVVLGSMGNSVDFKRVNNVNDLLCKFDSTKLVKEYSNIKKGIYYLLNAFKNTDFYYKNNTSIDDFEKSFNTLPDELDADRQSKYIYRLEKFKYDNC